MLSQKRLPSWDVPTSVESLVLRPTRPVDPDAINEAIDRGWGYETIAYVLNRTVEEIIRAGSRRAGVEE